MIVSPTDFDRLIKRDRRRLRVYLAIAGVVVMLGAALVLVSFATGAASGDSNLLLRLGGAFVASLSALPVKECFDRYERIASVEWYRDKWKALASSPGPRAEDLNKMEDFVLRLYEQRALG